MLKLLLPPEIERAIKLGAVLAVSISGGKDGQAMLMRIVQEYYRRGWTNVMFVVHADLGRAEWEITPDEVLRQAYTAGLPLIVVRRPQGDLVQEIIDRMHKLSGTDKPFWPSSQNRYCTSDQKRMQIDKVLRAPFWPSSQNRYCTSHHKANQIDKVLRTPAWPDGDEYQAGFNSTPMVKRLSGASSQLIISLEGIRAEESPERRKKQPVSIRKSITSTRYLDMTPADALDKFEGGETQFSMFDLVANQARLALNWYPVFEWTEADVYRQCGHSLEEVQARRELSSQGRYEEALTDWYMHPAYPLGSTRLSCAICVLSTARNITVGARHNRAVYRIYRQLEDMTGVTFKNGWSLAEIEDKL